MSGVEMAMWDLLGKARGEPVWKLLGYARSHPKTPYASVLFGDAPQATLEHAKAHPRATASRRQNSAGARSVAAARRRTATS